MTRNHDYSTPEAGEPNWHVPINDNFRQIDTNIEIRDYDNQRSEYEPKQGAKFYATDSYDQYLGNGSEWIRIPVTGLNPDFDSVRTPEVMTHARWATAIIRTGKDGEVRGVTGDDRYRSSSFRDVLDSLLTDLKANSERHKTVVIRGSFKVENSDGPIKLPPRTTLVLQGTLTATDETTTLVSVEDYSTLRGGTYDGARGDSDGGDVGVSVVSVDSCTNVTLDSIRVENGWARGIEVDYPDNIRIHNVTVQNCHRNLMVWVDPKDLKDHDGVCYVDNFTGLDAVDTSFDITASVLQINGFYSRGSAPAFVADGWRNLTMTNVDVDNGLNFTTGDWTGNVADGAVLSNISAQNLYFNFATGMRDLQLQNIRISGGNDGIRFGIESDQPVESIELSNVIVRDCDWSGIIFQQPSGSGRFDTIMLNNCHVCDNDQDGFYVEQAGAVKLNNCIFAGNEECGVAAVETTDLSLTNTDTLDSERGSHRYSLSLRAVERFKAACCTFKAQDGYESDEATTTLTAACTGTYPL